MSPLAALALGLTAGAITIAPVAWSVSRRRTLRDSDVVSYDSQRDWRAIAEQADHDHRSALRFARALDVLDRIHRDVIGGLLDTVAGLQAENDLLRAPRHTRRSPIPPYGRRVA